MTTYKFIEQHDYLLNETYFFTKKDGLTVTGSMSNNRDKAYDIFCRLISGDPKDKETVIFDVKVP